MATYVMMMKWTERGAAGIADAKKGREAGKKAAKAAGVTWKQSYLIMGDYDVMVILEAPDEKTMARFALLGSASGAVRSTTFRAFTEDEADELVGSLGKLTEQTGN